MCWLAGDDPIKLNALSQMPMVEYFALLNKRIAHLKKQAHAPKVNHK